MAARQLRVNGRVPQWPIDMPLNQQQINNPQNDDSQVVPVFRIGNNQNNNHGGSQQQQRVPLDQQQTNNPQNDDSQVIPVVRIGNNQNNNNHGMSQQQQRVQNLQANFLQEFRHITDQDLEIEDDKVTLEKLRQQTQVLGATGSLRSVLRLGVSKGQPARSGNQV